MSPSALIVLALALLAILYWRQTLVLLIALASVVWIPLMTAAILVFGVGELIVRSLRRSK